MKKLVLIIATTACLQQLQAGREAHRLHVRPVAASRRRPYPLPQPRWPHRDRSPYSWAGLLYAPTPLYYGGRPGHSALPRLSAHCVIEGWLAR